MPSPSSSSSSQIPTFITTRPLILITGFLGAGKTTLLRELLQGCKEKELLSDVILNDYSDANVDLITLEDHARNIEPLTAACACCEGMDFLLELSLKSSKSDSDILFVELNGTADPVPIIESFTLLHEKLQLHPRWQVCVIDVRNFGKRTSYEDIELLQLQTASHLYFTHENEAKDLTHASIIDKIREVNPSASVISKEQLLEQIIQRATTPKKLLIKEETAQQSSAIHQVKPPSTHHKTHEFTSCQIPLPDNASEQVIRQWLADIPESVIRAKVLIGVTEKPKHRYLFERVNLAVSKYTQRVSLDKERVPNSAIFIGPDLDPEALQLDMEQSLVE